MDQITCDQAIRIMNHSQKTWFYSSQTRIFLDCKTSHPTTTRYQRRPIKCIGYVPLPSAIRFISFSIFALSPLAFPSNFVFICHTQQFSQLPLTSCTSKTFVFDRLDLPCIRWVVIFMICLFVVFFNDYLMMLLPFMFLIIKSLVVYLLWCSLYLV